MLTDAEITILLRTFLAALLGMLIGWERRAVGAPVRGRIIILVTMTAAAITAIGLEMHTLEAGRVVAGIVTGIGFLGAGVIIRSSTGEVRGHRTAAALWAMSCVGIIIGVGHAILGIILTLLIYLIIAWDEWPIVTRFKQRQAERKAKNTESKQSSETQDFIE